MQVVFLYARGVFMLPPQPPRHHVHDHMQEYDFDADGIDADERVALQRTYVVQKIGLGAGAVMQAALTAAMEKLSATNQTVAPPITAPRRA